VHRGFGKGEEKMKLLKPIIKIFLLLGTGMILYHVDMAEAGNSHLRIIRQKGLEVRLDLSTQVLGLEIPEDRGWGRSSGKAEAELYPTIKSVSTRLDFVSASILVAKAKQFDDGLYAAVDYLCQDGTKRVVGKRELLQRVSDALKGLTKDKQGEVKGLYQSRAFILAAANLGGQVMAETKEVQLQAEVIKSKFLSEPEKSKPISYYTWTEDLTKIFQQDRLLQKDLNSEEVRHLAEGLSRDGNALKTYQTYLSLIKRLTNPFPPEYGDLSQIKETERKKKYRFFPPSQAPETELIKKLYGDRPIPDGFNLADELVKRIQKREINLTPQTDSGWYDHQLFALESFVNPELMPESQRLFFGKDYKKELINLFKASIALTRETHVKQLEISHVGKAISPPPKVPIIEIYPELSIEPTATYYLRRARSYHFVRELLESTFGGGTLKNTHRLTSSGRVFKTLLEELREVESLFYGNYQVVAEEIGMDIDTQLPERSQQQKERDRNLAREWIQKFTEDPDVGADNRMMVPVFYDVLRKKTKVWVVLGYVSKPLSVWFEKEPKATVLDATGKKAEAKLNFRNTRKSLIYPVSAEVYVKKVMNRDEFRALCDRYKTASAILKALQNL
jgi:hypothetical protein